MEDEFSVVLRAREFVKRATIDLIPVNLDRYLNLEGINARCKITNDMEEEEAGQTTIIGGRHCIFVNGKHSRERQRFTICHELTHIALNLPSAHEQTFGMNALYSYDRRPKEEMLCDVFAAECLLPSDFFKRDVENSLIGFNSIVNLAEKYKASLTSTGSRFALNTDEPSAFVLVQSGRIRYVSSSVTMREWGGRIQIGASVPAGSIAQRLLDGHSVNGPEEVATHLWLDTHRRGGPVLLEESRLLGRWDQVLSLLWFEPDGSIEGWESEDDEPALEELDGILPWPSKKRRR